MIQSFADKDAEAIYRGKPVRTLAPIQRIVERKLVQINQARSLRDLRAIPGNRLEELKGKRSGEFSVRVNDQFRIVFRWLDDGPHDVRIEDYH